MVNLNDDTQLTISDVQLLNSLKNAVNTENFKTLFAMEVPNHELIKDLTLKITSFDFVDKNDIYSYK